MDWSVFHDKSDEDLARMCASDPHAFVPLVRRYEGRLLAYIRRISGFNKEDAEDVLQEAFLDAYRHITDFDTSLKFSSWIYRIVHNRTISAYRKLRNRLSDVSIDDEDMGFDRLLAGHGRTDHGIESILTSQAVRKILDKLPERDRQVLVLSYLEERSYEEISDILRAPLGTIGTWIRRAKVKFAKAAGEKTALI